jgi:hypothetical protein
MKNKNLSIAFICLVLAIISMSYVSAAADSENISVENVTPPAPGPTPGPTPNGTNTTPSNGGNSHSQASGYSTGVPLLALLGVLSVAGLTFYRKR